VRSGAAKALGLAFQYMTDKEQASKDLLALTKDENSEVRMDVADALVLVFLYIADKKQASKDLLALTKDENSHVRGRAANALGMVFQYMTNKEQTSKDLLELTKDKNSDVRRGAANVLGLAFQYMTDKEQAWKDLLTLNRDEDSNVRSRASGALGLAFPYITDKEQASKDLLTLMKDENSDVRRRAADALGPAFKFMTDEEQASKDLLTLTKDKNGDVRRGAADALGLAFKYMTDKEQTSKDLLKLTKDKNSYVRRGAANALGSAFQYMTDKEQAWKDLLALNKDEIRDVRIYANYSLGKISIYKATEAESEERLKKEMDKAIGYFEKSLQESTNYNPAIFCLPFYRSYNAVIFRQEKAEEEVKRNLKEAKQAVAGSESKEKLLEAVENLANALQEAKKLRDLDEIQAYLNAYRGYCDRAVELLDETEDKAPRAAKLMRRGMPIIDERIKAILAEIQEKTEALFRESVDSPLEDLGKEVNKIGQNLLPVRDPIGLEKSVNNLEIALSDICNRMVGKEKGEACQLLEREKKEEYIEDKLPLMSMILSKVSSQITDKQKSGIREELVISVGGTLFGIGAQHNITIPLQEIAYDDLKNDLKTIGNKDVFNLATLPPKLAEKVNKYIDKIKCKK